MSKKAIQASEPKKFRTMYMPYTPNPGTINKEESLCRPSQSLSARQLYENHTRGHMIGVNVREGIYSETEVPWFEDITDMMAHKEHLAEQAKILEKEIMAESEKQKKAAEAAQKEKDELLALKKEMDHKKASNPS